MFAFFMTLIMVLYRHHTGDRLKWSTSTVYHGEWTSIFGFLVPFPPHPYWLICTWEEVYRVSRYGNEETA